MILLTAAMALSQQRDLEQQNEVKRRSEERLAEIDKMNKAIAGDMLRSERDLRLARSTIEAKRKIATVLDNETRRVTREMDSGTRRARSLDDDLAALKKDYAAAVRTAWKNSLTNNATLLLLSSRDFNDASRRISFLRRYNRARRERGASIASTTTTLRAEIDRLAAKKTEIAGLQTQSDALLATLAKEEARYKSALETLGRDRKKLEAEAQQEREKIAAAQREIDRIMKRQAEEAKRAAALSEAEMALSGRFGDNRGRLPWPVGSPATPGLILHRFGKERSADGIESDFKGLIIAAAAGSEVRAVFEGQVTGIFELGQYDKCVMVRSGEYVVGYGNVATPAVASGARVTLGQSLGRVGTSTNPDRHLVLLWMQRGNEVLNPEQWLRK